MRRNNNTKQDPKNKSYQKKGPTQNSGKGRGKRCESKKDYDFASDNVKDTNNPAWYALNPQLLKDSASFPYAWPSGNIITGANGTMVKQYTPGVVSIDVIPTIGESNDNTSAVNVQARNIYSWVRHANSGHANYDAPDLMMYILAMAELYAQWAHLVRIYGVARGYNVMNKYMPTAILQAMGVDPTGLQENLADFRAAINRIALQIGSLAVPASMPVFDRYIQLFSGVYRDSNSPKAQLYVLNLAGTHRWTEQTEGPGYLQYNRGPNATDLSTWQEHLGFVTANVNAMISSEDCGIISGDILKAFQGNIRTLPMLSEDYMVFPTYDMEMLSQIQNCRFTGELDNTDSGKNTATSKNLDIRQDPSFASGHMGTPIICRYWFKSAATPSWIAEGKVLINAMFDDVQPADSMVLTRFTWAKASDSGRDYILASGTELATHWHICRYETNTTGALQLVWTTNQTNEINTTLVDEGIAIKNSKALQIMLFDFHFPIQVTLYTNEGGVSTTSGWLFDLNNFTVLDPQDMVTLHSTALFSEYNVPITGVSLG